MPKLKILQKGLLIVLVPFALNLVWIGLFYRYMQHAASCVHEENQEGAVLVGISRGVAIMNQILLHGTEYIESGGPASGRRQIISDREQLLKCIADVKNITRNDKEVDVNLDSLTESIVTPLQTTRALEHTYEANNFINDLFVTMPPNWAQNSGVRLAALLDIMSKREEHFRKTMEMGEIERNKTRLIAFSGLVLNIIIAGAVVLFFQKHITSRIAKLASNALSLSKSDQLPEPIEGKDELSQLGEELQSVRGELLAQSAFRHSMMQMIAHNIQVPLLSCRQSIKNLEQSDSAIAQDGGDKQLRSLEIATTSCLRLVDDLLLMESLESGTLTLKIEGAEIKEIGDTAIDLVKGLATLKKLSLVNQSKTLAINVDRGRILEVVVNLLTNAIKFSPTNSTIVIRTDSEGGRLRFSVIDQGPGLEKSVRANLFQKFYQTESGKKAGGTGLGLAISKMIIASHDGIVGVDSSPGKGSTFWFEIPLQQSR